MFFLGSIFWGGVGDFVLDFFLGGWDFFFILFFLWGGYFCTVQYGTVQYSTVHGQVIFASKSWRCEGEEGEGEKVHLKTHGSTSWGHTPRK